MKTAVFAAVLSLLPMPCCAKDGAATVPDHLEVARFYGKFCTECIRQEAGFKKFIHDTEYKDGIGVTVHNIDVGTPEGRHEFYILGGVGIPWYRYRITSGYTVIRTGQTNDWKDIQRAIKKAIP